MERLALLLTLLVALLHAQGFTGPPPSCLASVYADQSKLLAPNCSVANLACLCTSLPFQASLPAALRVACVSFSRLQQVDLETDWPRPVELPMSRLPRPSQLRAALL